MNRKLRVLLISDSYPPVLGGSEIEAQRVSTAMIARGHEVRVLCAGGPPMPPLREWIDPTGVPVTILTRRTRGKLKDWVFALEVVRSLLTRRSGYDVVYFLMQGLHLAAGLPVARILGKPMVMKVAGSNVIPEMRRSRAGRVELDWLQRWGVPVMILNEGMREEALSDGFLNERLVWMPNPVDTDEFRPPRPGEAEAWREAHGIPRGARVTVYVGRLSHEKGLRGLMGGFAMASREEPEALLILVGDGPLKPELETQIRDLQIDPARVRFTGRVPAAEIPLWLRAAEVFALTSPSEGFACALLEAMSAGLPSVVSSIPANLQLVDEAIHGFTVPFDDRQAIADALLRLLRDPALRRSMGGRARLRVIGNYSTDKVIERYEALFNSVIDAGGG
jgi:glycosyltransferase involved in cell wall biosynthesis